MIKETALFTTVLFPLITRFERNNIQAIWRTDFMNTLRKPFLALCSKKSYTAFNTLGRLNLMCLPSCFLFQNTTREKDLFKKQLNYQDKEIETVLSFH